MKKRYLPFVIILTAVVVFFVVKKIYIDDKRIEPKHIEVNGFDEIVHIGDGVVPPIIYKSVPDLSALKIAERKKIFVDILLPSILIAKEQIVNDRELILDIIEDGEVDDSDTAFVNQQLKTYKVKTIDELPEHIVIPPVSVVLAQAAIESGWGTSRFFREGNNVFGMWSYSNSHERMKAGAAREDKQVYVRVFPDIYASVLNYCRTIGRLRAYKEFRNAMKTESDPYQLVDHLKRYSERGESYTQTVKTVMKKNDFPKYDNYILLSDWAYEEVADDNEEDEIVYD